MPKNLKDPNFYDDLMQLMHDVVKFAPNGHTARRIAALANQPYSTLMNSLSQAESNAGCKLDAAALEAIIAAAGGEKFVARYFAVKAGGAYVDLPAVPEDAEGARAVAMKAMSELGALCRSFEHALDDAGPSGADVTLDELLMFQAQADKFMAATQTLTMACRRALEAHRAEG